MNGTAASPDAEQAALTPRQRVVAAYQGLPALPVPIWLMRQAGRYLPEYREVRAGVDFLTLCKTPELAAEVTMQPMRRFSLDAAILFCDIMVPADAMGLSLRFEPGPVIEPALRNRHDLDGLRTTGDGLDYVYDAVATIRRQLGADRALLGFAGAPVTLATYLCEGRGARDFRHLKHMLHADPTAAHRLLETLVAIIGDFLTQQVAAGCDAVQLFDTWGGLLDPDDVRRFLVPHTQTLIARVREAGAPVIYFTRDTASLLPILPSLGADAYGVDWRLSLQTARGAVGSAGLAGNLDPTLLEVNAEGAARRAAAILGKLGGVGHVFNLGHGIHRQTPPEHVAALVDAVHAWRPAGR